MRSVDSDSVGSEDLKGACVTGRLVVWRDRRRMEYRQRIESPGSTLLWKNLFRTSFSGKCYGESANVKGSCKKQKQDLEERLLVYTNKHILRRQQKWFGPK